MTSSKKCLVEDKNIFYLREGAGDPVILLHGITTYSFIWRKIIPLLAKHYDTIAPDLLGCGGSDKPLDEDYSIKNQSEIVAGFIKKLKLNRVHLIAHDIGGGIAQILAVNYPELIKDVTVINTVAYDFWPVQPIVAMRIPVLRQLAMATLEFGAFKFMVNRGLFNKKVLTDELMELFWEPMKTPLGRKAFLHFAKCLNNKQLVEIEDKIHSITMPFLIIRGDQDVYLSSEISGKLHQNIKGSKLIKIPNAGHYMMEELPEEIANTLMQFLSEN